MTNKDNFVLLNLVAVGATLAPVQQRVPSGASMAPQHSTEPIRRSGRDHRAISRSFKNHVLQALLNSSLHSVI